MNPLAGETKHTQNNQATTKQKEMKTALVLILGQRLTSCVSGARPHSLYPEMRALSWMAAEMALLSVKFCKSESAQRLNN